VKHIHVFFEFEFPSFAPRTAIAICKLPRARAQHALTT
jgi:hypothetical protein